jgi:hypothetical protein
MMHVTKQMMMRKTASVQRLVLAGSSVDNEARPPFTKSRNAPSLAYVRRKEENHDQSCSLISSCRVWLAVLCMDQNDESKTAACFARSRRDGLRADHNDSTVGDVKPISIMFRVIADVRAVRYRDAFVENGFTNLAA